MRLIFYTLTLSVLSFSLFAQAPALQIVTGGDTTALICPGSCVSLGVQGLGGNQTNTYNVSQITYNNYPYNTGAPVGLNIDDTYSQAISLPFTFCYFGSAYNQIVIGTNGIISFNTGYAGGNCTWPIGAAWPSNAGNVLNSIACPWQDIDPGVSGTIYAGTVGVAPNRVYIVSFNNIAMFSCNNLIFNGQICLYETTNIIETYISNKPLCPNWNAGAAIHGIQNATGTTAFVVPGRNFPTQWTCTNDAWRWTPAGIPNYTLTWFENGTQIGTGPNITVCPTVQTNYTAQGVFLNCNGAQSTASDDITIRMDSLVLPVMQDVTLCPGDTAQLDAVIPTNGPLSFTNSTVTTIPAGTTVNIPVNVSGVVPAVFQPGNLLSVCVSVAAAITGQVNLFLVSPTGQTITLSTGNGGFTNLGYRNTCFTPATGVNISTYVFAAIPANLVCIPEQVGTFTPLVGSNNNGNWILQVQLANGGGATTFQSVTLNFANLNLITYSWSPTLGLSDPNIGNPLAYPANTTNYTVSAVSTLGCTASQDVLVSVSNLQFTAPVVTCGPADDSTVTFNWAPIPGATDYEISIDGGPYINVGNVTTYTVTGLVQNQTVTISVIANGPAQVTCNPSPPGTVSCTTTSCPPLPVSITGNLNFCDGQTTTLTATPGYATYVWNPGNVNGNTLTVNAGGTYSVVVADINGCSTTVSANVTAGLPPPTITGNLAYCQGSSTVLTASAGYLYAWDTGETTASITVNTPGCHTVTTTDFIGCTFTATACVNEIVVTPTITGNPIMCVGATTVLDAGVGYTAYNWGGGQTNQTFTVTVAGTYPVTVTDNNGCTGSTSFTVTSPVVAPTISGNLNACIGGTTVLDAGAGYQSYLWSTNEVTQTITVATAGPYSVTVTDNSGCTGSTTVNVQFTGPSPVITGTLAICQGTTTTLDAGAGYIGYNWGGGQTTRTITANTAGNYDVTVTAAGGCTASTTVAVTVTTVTTNITGPLAICPGVSTTLDAGAGFTAYIWNGGETTQTITVNTAGTYSVSVTGNLGCTASASVVVTNNPLVVNIAGTLNVCPNATTTLDAGAGNSYQWDNGAVTQTISVGPGSYCVTVTTPAGCTASNCVTVNLFPAPSPSITGTTSICAGTTTTLDAGSGYSGYSWTPGGETTQTITAGAQGNYNVLVTDANGCTGTASTTITFLPDLAPVITPNGPTSFCQGGSVILSAGAFNQYLWSNNAVTQSINVTTSGSYSVTVTNNLGCTGTAVINVVVFANPVVGLGNDQSICFGTNANLNATVIGGLSPYNYTWDNGLPNSPTQVVSPVVTTSYNVTVVDQNGCIGNDAINVVVNPLVVASAGNDTTICNGNSATLNASVQVGTGPFTYNWSGGLPNNAVVTVSPLSTTTYFLTVTDANGCTGSTEVTVTVNSSINVSAGADVTICETNSTVLTATATGGANPFTYDWNGAGNTASITVSPLVSTTYTVLVTDAFGCTGTDNVLVTVVPTFVPTITTPGGLLDFCAGTSITLTGQAGFVSYSWSGGATTQSNTVTSSGTYTLTATDATGCAGVGNITVNEFLPVTIQSIVDDVNCKGQNDGSIVITGIQGGSGVPNIYQWSLPGVNGPVATGLTAGTYTVTVTDDRGCTGSASIVVNEPGTAVGVAIVAANATCNGYANGVAIANPYGGSPGYTFTWSNGALTDTARFLAANVDYFVTVTDSQGCFVVDTVQVDEPTAITLIITNVQAARCHGSADGRARVNASGGTPGYSYQWSNGETNALATALAAGNATVTVGDAQGCTATVSVLISEPSPVNMNIINITPPNCNGTNTGSAIVVGSGGTPPYIGYVWDAGAGAQTTAAVTGLPAGTYTVTITDFHNCTFVGTVVVPDPVVLSVSIDQLSPILCHGDTTGSLQAVAVGGTGTYTYDWSSGQTTDMIDNQLAGLYAVTVTDAGGCTAAASAVLDEPDSLILSAIMTPVRCNGGDDGEIALSAVGGRLPYEYSNNAGATWTVGSNFDGLTSDFYEVAVRDNYGCIDSFTIEVTQPDTFVATLLPLDTTIEYSQNVVLQITTNAPATYTWVMDTTLSCLDCAAPIATPTMTTIYEVTVRDTNGCIIELQSRVELIFPRRAYVANLFTPNGDGHNELFLVQGGTGVQTVRAFRVYDRWGELVWQAENVAPNDVAGGWNGEFKGKKVPSGVFVWYAEIVYADGFVETLKGDVTLLR